MPRTLTLTHHREIKRHKADSPVLQPWVEYLKRLTEPDRSILIHDLRVVVGLEV